MVSLQATGPNAAAAKKSWLPTRKWWAATVLALGAIATLWVDEWDSSKRLGMLLPVDQSGSNVKPEEVVAALAADWQVQRVHRRSLTFAEQAAHAA